MRRLAAVLLFCAVPLAADEPADPRAQDLGHLGGNPFPVYVSVVAKTGWAAGAARKPGTEFDVPVAWTAAGGFTAIADVPGFGLAVNGLGQVVGYLQPPDGPQEAFIWSKSAGRATLSWAQAQTLYPRVINDKGQVAGEFDSVNGGVRAFLWSSTSGFRDLGSLGGGSVSVVDINENGWVVGHAQDVDGNTRAFLSHNGARMRSLGTLGGDWSYATAINDQNMVVGYARNALNNGRAFVYVLNRMTELPAPTTESFAYDINASGMIVGHGSTFGEQRALVWSAAGAVSEIPGQRAEKVNDAGVVAVVEETSPPYFSPRAKLWAGGPELIDAGSDDEQWSQPLGLTSDGGLLGRRYDWSGTQKAYLWKAGTRTLLDGLPGGGSSRALLINAAGQVAGVSRTKLGYDRAFLWTPGTGMKELPAPAGADTTPVALNASGAVLGSASKLGVSGTAFYTEGSSVHELGPVWPVDLNDLGQSLIASNDGAWLWSTSGVQALPAFGERPLMPKDLNNLGQVVGACFPTWFSQRAFSWKPGTSPVDLGTLGGEFAEAVAVNDAGRIAGNSARADGEIRAFRTAAAGAPLTELPSLFAAGSAKAVAMNANGDVAGTCDFFGELRAFLHDTRLRDLGPVYGGVDHVQGLNDSREVVGATLPPPFGYPRGFLSVGGAPLTDLGTLGGDLSMAHDINWRGEVAGRSELPDGQMRAVLWRTR